MLLKRTYYYTSDSQDGFIPHPSLRTPSHPKSEIRDPISEIFFVPLSGDRFSPSCGIYNRLSDHIINKRGKYLQANISKPPILHLIDRGKMEAKETLQPDIECDFHSLRCPNLLIAVIKKVEETEVGQVLRVTARDLNAPSSLGSWTRQSGHTLLDMYEENGDFVFLIQCRPEAISMTAGG
jgi:tRNA 2-thiouridine synthesizing protein A